MKFSYYDSEGILKEVNAKVVAEANGYKLIRFRDSKYGYCYDMINEYGLRKFTRVS